MSLKTFVSYWKVYKQNHEFRLFFIKTLKVKIDKKFLLNSELLIGFFLNFLLFGYEKVFNNF